MKPTIIKTAEGFSFTWKEYGARIDVERLSHGRDGSGLVGRVAFWNTAEKDDDEALVHSAGFNFLSTRSRMELVGATDD